MPHHNDQRKSSFQGLAGLLLSPQCGRGLPGTMILFRRLRVRTRNMRRLDVRRVPTHLHQRSAAAVQWTRSSARLLPDRPSSVGDRVATP